MKAEVSTDAWTSGGAVPRKYTCDGEDVSPAVKIGGVPEEAKSLVLIMDDPDAPMGTWNHWILYDIPPDTKELPEGYAVSGSVKSGVNDFGNSGYGGPCPPKGSKHRYYLKLFALNVANIGLPAGADRDTVDAAMRDKVLPGLPVEYMGTYVR
jgi:hypothetical protein